jgi:hypothetical protein
MRMTNATLGPRAESRARRERSWPTWLSLSTVTVGVLVALGMALRLAYYLRSPALSSDEAALALNLMHRSYAGLFHQLDVNQAAPPGFLLMQKLVIDALGPSPYVLRFLPLVGGIVALLIFFPVAKRLVDTRTAIVALALFTISDPLLTYAGTNKPYSIDVAAALVLYAVFVALLDRPGIRGSFVLALSGAIAVWLSYASVFVLTAIVAVWLIRVGRTARPAELVKLLLPIMVLLGSFIAAYALTRASVTHLQDSLGRPGLFSSNGSPGVLQTSGGIARFLFGVPDFSHGARSAIAFAGLAVALVGAGAMARTRLSIAGALLIPGFIALIVASTSKYALFPRTFLFLAPALAIVTARGALSLMSRGRVLALTGTICLATLLAAASYGAVERLSSTGHADSVRTLRYLTQNFRPGDALYLHLSAQLDFRYYLECGCFGSVETVQKARSFWPVRGMIGEQTFIRSAPPNLIAGSAKGTTPSDYSSDLAPFLGRRRVWILVMDPDASAQRALARYAAEIGRRKGLFPRSDSKATASVALYDLRR